jgi:hypothetical protein
VVCCCLGHLHTYTVKSTTTTSRCFSSGRLPKFITTCPRLRFASFLRTKSAEKQEDDASAATAAAAAALRSSIGPSSSSRRCSDPQASSGDEHDYEERWFVVGVAAATTDNGRSMDLPLVSSAPSYLHVRSSVSIYLYFFGVWFYDFVMLGKGSVYFYSTCLQICWYDFVLLLWFAFRTLY